MVPIKARSVMYPSKFSVDIKKEHNITFVHRIKSTCQKIVPSLTRRNAPDQINPRYALVVTTTIRLPLDGRSTAYKRSLRSQ